VKDLGQQLCETLMLYKSEPIRILLVEDNDSDAVLAMHEINDSRVNCLVEHVHTGEDGIEAVKLHASTRDYQFDVAIIDLVLPGQSGLEAAKHMVEFAPLIVIFICSGHCVQPACLSEAIDKGFAILPKPLRRTHIEMIINAVKVAKEKMPAEAESP
jgi:two-component system, NtrC family, response regulator AtoC